MPVDKEFNVWTTVDDVDEGKKFDVRESDNNEKDNDKISTKENIKWFIDKSKNSQELYENAVKVLMSMESNFIQTLKDVSEEENWDSNWKGWIDDSVFDKTLDTSNPVTLFEKKWKEILERWKALEERIKLQNAASQTVGELDLLWITEIERNRLVEELFQTRADAIQNFKNDVKDWILSDENNISTETLHIRGTYLWEDLFWLKEENNQKFEEKIGEMDLVKLIFSTFNIKDWSWAFTYAYGKLKERLWNKNLFDFIDEQEKEGDQIWEILRFSVFKILFQRRMIHDLSQMMKGYTWDKEKLLNFVKTSIENYQDFKISFLTSIDDLENSEYFWKMAQDLKESDPEVRQACDTSSNYDNIDLFREKKVNWLILYDDAWHWWWSAYFNSNIKDYQKKGYKIISEKTKDNKDYTKYVLRKGEDVLTMVKLKIEGNGDLNLKWALESLNEGEDYNLFVLRGHCYHTSSFAKTLWEIGAVWEWDLLIDGWCNNWPWMRKYWKKWVKGKICGYSAMGQWAVTQRFVDNIIAAKDSWQSFSEVLQRCLPETMMSSNNPGFQYAVSHFDDSKIDMSNRVWG